MWTTEFYTYWMEPEYSAVKAVDSDLIVAGPSTVFANYNYWRQFLEAGGHSKTDALSFHPYDRPTLGWMADWSVDYSQRWLDGYNSTYGTEIKLWNTELFEYHPGYLGQHPLAWEPVQRIFLDAYCDPPPEARTWQIRRGYMPRDW